MMVTATKVEALPMGVKLPPRLAPNTTDHQSEESGLVPAAARIFASIAANGILSVTELNTADRTNNAPVPKSESSVPITNVIP